ncbi:MAG: HEAT repeat domain-containing protein [Planctomycetes bacterium]|nr:HEAT repeat domain-containing protein [Planctomycetota bacterium]
MQLRHTFFAVLVIGALALVWQRCDTRSPGLVPPPQISEEEFVARQTDVRALQRFIEAHPASPRLADARKRIDALRADDAPWEHARRAATSVALDEFLELFPGHEREADARALRAAMEPRSVFDLLANGAIELTTRGSGIEHMSVTLRRRTPHEISATFPVGTYFVAQGDSQNMVATRATTVKLDTDDPVDVTVRVACANRSLPVPGHGDSFHLELAPRQAELEKLAPLLEAADASTVVAQAAVWIVTDDADYDALGLLVLSYGFGGGRRAIDETAAATALKLCADAGVDWRSRAIAKDEFVLFHGLGAEHDGAEHRGAERIGAEQNGAERISVAEWCRAELERRGFGATPGAIVSRALEQADDGLVADAARSVAAKLAKSGGMPTLRELARAESPRTRRRAALVLAELAAPADLDLLLALANDATPAVRAAAAAALKSFDAPRARAGLLRALGDADGDVANTALTALGGVQAPELVDPLLGLAGSQHEGWLRSEAVRRLAELHAAAPTRAPELRAAFERALEDPDDRVALAALDGLAKTRDPTCVAGLAAAFAAHREPWFRIAVIRALQELGGPAARAERVRWLATPDIDVAMSAFGSLREELDADLVPEIVRLLERTEAPYHHEELLHALGRLRTPEARTHVRRLAESADRSACATALAALAAIADPRDRELVVGLVHADDEDVRAAALRALHGFQDASNQTLCSGALVDPSDAVVDAALDGLQKPYGPELVTTFEAALRVEHEAFLRSRLANELASIETPEATRALLRIFVAKKEVRFRWELALGFLAADPSALAELEAAHAGETDDEVRALLEQALANVRSRLPPPPEPQR